MASIGIIVPVYNYEATLERCVGSIVTVGLRAAEGLKEVKKWGTGNEISQSR